MKNTFDNIFTSILEEYEKNPNIEQVQENNDVWELSKEGAKRLEAINLCIDKHTQKIESIVQARKNGLDLEDWISEEFEAITKNCSEEEKEQLNKVINDSLENYIANFESKI